MTDVVVLLSTDVVSLAGLTVVAVTRSILIAVIMLNHVVGGVRVVELVDSDIILAVGVKT